MLPDIADIVCGGTPSTSVPEYWKPEVDWVTAKDISECDLVKIWKTERLISRKGLENSSAKMLPALATVLIARGATMGKCRMIARPMALNQTCYGIVARENADPRFLFYVLNSMYEHFRAVAHGTVFDTVIGSGLQRLQMRIPDLSEQKTVADVLEILDNKIELNRRMNEMLEAMARAIFKSWFVDFDPVRAKAEGRQPYGMDASTAALFPDSFQGSFLGQVPMGWRQSSLEQVIAIHDSKRIPLSGRQRAERQGPYPYYGAASVMDQVDSFLFDGIYVLVGEDGSVINDDDTPVVQYVWGRFWVNNHAHVLRGKGDISNEHLLLFLRQTNFRAFITGAVQPKLNQGNLCKVPFLIPPSHVCTAFERMVQPIFSELRANTEQSRTLAALRDALLPKLISGEFRVKDAEKLAEKTA